MFLSARLGFLRRSLAAPPRAASLGAGLRQASDESPSPSVLHCQLLPRFFTSNGFGSNMVSLSHTILLIRFILDLLRLIERSDHESSPRHGSYFRFCDKRSPLGAPFSFTREWGCSSAVHLLSHHSSSRPILLAEINPSFSSQTTLSLFGMNMNGIFFMYSYSADLSDPS